MPKNEISYGGLKAAKEWVQGEIAAGRLENIPRTDSEILELFTPHNVVKHMAMENQGRHSVGASIASGGEL